MMLLLRGTDIGSLTLGIQQKGEEMRVVTQAARPEEHLQVLQRFLVQQQRTLRDITELLIVSGEGSATALRTSVTLGNALAWANGWKVREVVVPAVCGEEELLTRLEEATVVHVARPHYATAPHITQATHDALKRKL